MFWNGWTSWCQSNTGFNIREEDNIHESILFGVPWSSDDTIVINYCILYAKQHIYLIDILLIWHPHVIEEITMFWNTHVFAPQMVNKHFKADATLVFQPICYKDAIPIEDHPVWGFISMPQLPYLKIVQNFLRIGPRLWHFQIQFGPFLCPTWSYWWSPFSADKIGLSLSHLVPQILGLNFGHMFQKNLLFEPFSSILYQFFSDFRYCWPPFYCRYVYPLVFQNLRSYWVHRFFHHAMDPLSPPLPTKHLVKYPTPRHRWLHQR